MNSRMEEIMETFKQVKINLPLLEAVKQIPAYAKFLKDLCTQKRKSRNHVSKKIFLTEQVSSILKYDTPPKLKDPGAPTITCVIGKHTIHRALLDLGASVNILPYSVYEELGLGELQPTSVTLQLADRSVKKPRGVIEDVLVGVDKFIFPVDFLVLDMEPVSTPSHHMPVILGRPFLATAKACINCRTGVLDVSFGNMKVRLNIFNASNQLPCMDDSECFMVIDLSTPIDQALPYVQARDILKACLAYFNVDKAINVTLNNQAPEKSLPWKSQYEPCPTLSNELICPPSETSSKLELKPPPAIFKSVFLGPGHNLSVITAANLSYNQESQLLGVLGEHKSTIRCTLANLKGSGPIDKIQMKEDEVILLDNAIMCPTHMIPRRSHNACEDQFFEFQELEKKNKELEKLNSKLLKEKELIVKEKDQLISENNDLKLTVDDLNKKISKVPHEEKRLNVKISKFNHSSIKQKHHQTNGHMAHSLLSRNNTTSRIRKIWVPKESIMINKYGIKQIWIPKTKA